MSVYTRENVQKRNYQREMEEILRDLGQRGEVPGLLLHSCCAPCSSYVLEALAEHFFIVDYFYNPNISPEEEYDRRARELERLVEEMPHANPVRFVEGRYEPERYDLAVKGLEGEPEGGERCTVCFELRLREAAEKAKTFGCTFFTTTLTISPHKDAARINAIGERIAAETGLRFLPSDFKKKDGFKRSTELSQEYGLYRQDSCGCVYSRRFS